MYLHLCVVKLIPMKPLCSDLVIVYINMAERSYIADIEKLLEGGKKPIELLNAILGFLNFKPIEIKIYNLLLNSSLTIKQIEDRLNLSERTIRKYIRGLDQRGFIIKKVEQGKRLKYVYTAVPIQEAWRKVKGKMQEILDEVTRVLEIKAEL
jgi:predicted transcriptional regulator